VGWHGGIIYVHQQALKIGEIIRRIRTLVDLKTGEKMGNHKNFRNNTNAIKEVSLRGAERRGNPSNLLDRDCFTSFAMTL
jgi:hypothetical protein